MARFRIQINEEADSLVIGSVSNYGSEHVKISELDAFVGALRAAAAFATANADLPKPAEKEPVVKVAEPEAAE